MTDALKPCPKCGAGPAEWLKCSHITCRGGEIFGLLPASPAPAVDPLDDPRVEALVDLIKRAEHNIPEYYTLWHSDARAALSALEGRT